MNLGKHIRENRLRLNLTQERLAEKLSVTAQAVSKWESGTGMPDIVLLPELSTIFGVTIDELFETSEEMHLNRIEAMVEKETMLSRADFDYAISRLEGMLHKPEHKARCLTLLGDLCMHRSNGYAEKAAEYAKQALDIKPDSHDNHGILFHARHGGLGDWCCTNHTWLIDFYREFVRKNPNHLPGYMWLTDNLIADGRLEEAEKTIQAMKKVEETYHYPSYLAMIAESRGDHEKAAAHWRQMLAEYPTNATAWFVYADHLVKHARYQEAIEAFEKSMSLAEKPRMTDALDSIAQIHLLLDEKEKAIAAYERILRIMREDWQMTEGETIEGYLQNIRQLKN